MLKFNVWTCVVYRGTHLRWSGFAGHRKNACDDQKQGKDLHAWVDDTGRSSSHRDALHCAEPQTVSTSVQSSFCVYWLIKQSFIVWCLLVSQIDTILVFFAAKVRTSTANLLKATMSVRLRNKVFVPFPEYSPLKDQLSRNCYEV